MKNTFKSFFASYLFPVLGVSSLLILGIGLPFDRFVVCGSELSAGKINRLITIDDSDEIPCFGSSRMISGVYPDKLHRKAFNYGVAGTGNYVMFRLLKIELSKSRQTPIIMNLDPWDYKRDIGDLDNYLKNASHPVIKEILGEDDRWFFHIPVIKYYGRFNNYLTYHFLNHTSSIYYVDKGALLNKSNCGMNSDTFMDYARSIPQYSSMRFDKDVLDDLLRLLSTTKRRVFFVSAPIFHSEIVMTSECQQDKKAIVAKLTSLPNVKHVDLTDAFQDPKDFFNVTHLSLNGSIKYSELLQKAIFEK